MDSTSGGCGVESSEPKSLGISSTASTTPFVEGSSRALSCRYESQKRRDWKTFLQYLENHKPPLAIASCSASHIIEFMRHLDQFGKTKMHLPWCVNFGRQNSAAVCDCPLKQAWGSLDALIGRLRAAYEENGGDPEINPFGARDVRLYLKELREVQAKARGIPYLKKRKRPTTTSTSVSVAGITQVVDRSTGSVGGSVSGGFVTSTDRTAQVDGYSCNGGAGGGGVGYTCDVNAVVTSVSEITRVVDASGDSDGSASFDAGGVVAPMTGISQAIDDNTGACCDSISDAVGVITSMNGVTQAIDGSTGGCGDSKSDAGPVLTSMAGITHVVDGGSTSKSGWLVTTEITQLVDDVISSGGGGSTADADGVVNDEKMMTPMLIPGTLVEVNLPDMQYHDAWVPAKILKVGYNQSVFLVGYKNSRLSYDEWCSKATVDALHIRPSPPENLEGKNFHVSEKVDFYYDWGWWSGEVTKVLVDNRYNVRSDYHKIEREFNQFELRCHAEWINGRWVHDSRDIGTKQDQVDVTGNDQADLLRVCNTEVIATESNTRKQMTGPPAAESSKGTPSQLEGSSDHPVPDLGLDKTGSLEDCGTCGRHETAVDLNFSALSNSDKKQLESSETQARCLEMVLAVSSPKDCTKSHGEATESSMVLIAYPEKAIPTTPKLSEGLSEHPSLNFDQESALWTIETEQCEISETQVEPFDLAIAQVDCSDKTLVFQSPLSTQAPDEQQQCRRNGTRWRCSKTAVPGKLYCERHLLERSIHNDKRRKTPRVERIVDPFDGKRCRRSGTGWRCHEMVSPGKQHCEKHRLLLDTYNEKRRKKVIQPVDQTNKGHQQCMRKGRGWRCPEMVSPGKRYCDKH